jgi:hypothetical protein
MPVNNLVPVPQQDLDTLAGVIRTEHQAVGLAAKNMLEHALRAGDALQAAKQQVADGRWETWVRKHCDLSLRCAQVYMQLAAARLQIEAQAQHAAPRSLRAALKLIGPKPGIPSRSRNTTSKPKPATSFDATGWWSGASNEARQHFIDGVGWSGLRAATPASWDLEGRMLRTLSAEKLLSELERRLPLDLRKKHQPALKAIARALESPEQHAGPTLDLEAIPFNDSIGIPRLPRGNRSRNLGAETVAAPAQERQGPR